MKNLLLHFEQLEKKDEGPKSERQMLTKDKTIYNSILKRLYDPRVQLYHLDLKNAYNSP
ncbi:hypothetical protein [Wolbachia endosymbiont (group B) of Agrotis exclamationis]|uniref:hypothetical protein n=1 Tax=Wolbachia endosymbiont (group B) of Agrotis exclamationis TaxID=3066161 RepID=UPI003132CC40